MTRKTVLSTTIPAELVDLFKSKAAALREHGIKGVSSSSLAAAFLANNREILASIDPQAAADELNKEGIPKNEPGFVHFSMSCDATLVELIDAKVKAMNKLDCPVSRCSLTAAFLMGEQPTIEAIDADVLAKDLLEGADGTERNRAGRRSPEGEAAQASAGDQEDEDSPGEDGGDAEGPEDGDEGDDAPAGSEDGDEEVVGPQEGESQ